MFCDEGKEKRKMKEKGEKNRADIKFPSVRRSFVVAQERYRNSRRELSRTTTSLSTSLTSLKRSRITRAFIYQRQRELDRTSILRRGIFSYKRERLNEGAPRITHRLNAIALIY